MDLLVEITGNVKKYLSNDIEVYINSDDVVLLMVNVNSKYQADCYEYEAFNNKDKVFKGLQYKFNFNYINCRIYKCVVKVWCTDFKEMFDTLWKNGYEPVERIGNTDYIICASMGNSIDSVRVIASDDSSGPMNLF